MLGEQDYKSIFYATTDCKLTNNQEISLALSIYEINGERNADLKFLFYPQDIEEEWGAPDAVVRGNYISFADADGKGYLLLRGATKNDYKKSDGFILHYVKSENGIISGQNGYCDEWLFEHEGL